MLVRHCNDIGQASAIMKRRLAIVCVAMAVSVSAASAAEPCRSTPIGTAQVAAVRDGRTLMLADGRELRLAAIEAGEASAAALKALTDGQALRLEQHGSGTDRYGRLVAFAYAGEATQSLQIALLEQGAARVSARVGDKACADLLLAAETKARAAGRGLWNDPNFAPLPADNLRRMDTEMGRFRVGRRQGLVGA